MAFREVLVTQVVEVLRAWLAGQGKRPAAKRAGVDVKTAQRYVRAAQEAGLARDGGEAQLRDELLGLVVAAVRPSRCAAALRAGRRREPGPAEELDRSVSGADPGSPAIPGWPPPEENGSIPQRGSRSSSHPKFSS